jgi:hypothetical protein
MTTPTVSIDFSPQKMLEIYIGTCHTCTIAQCMRDCPQCRFKVGLNTKPVHLPVSSITQEPLFKVN